MEPDAQGETANPAPKPAPVMDVTPPPQPPMATPPVEQSEDKPAVTIPAEVAAPPAPNKAYKPPKKPSVVPTIAIVATVVIVLGIAALAVYAYLQTKK